MVVYKHLWATISICLLRTKFAETKPVSVVLVRKSSPLLWKPRVCVRSRSALARFEGRAAPRAPLLDVLSTDVDQRMKGAKRLEFDDPSGRGTDSRGGRGVAKPRERSEEGNRGCLGSLLPSIRCWLTSVTWLGLRATSVRRKLSLRSWLSTSRAYLDGSISNRPSERSEEYSEGLRHEGLRDRWIACDSQAPKAELSWGLPNDTAKLKAYHKMNRNKNVLHYNIL